jgi:hypothetical protein
MLNSCANHPTRPAFVEKEGKQLCLACYQGEDYIWHRFQCSVEEFYNERDENGNTEIGKSN